MANWIFDVIEGLESGNSDAAEAAVKEKIIPLCDTLPVYK
jgi:glycine hydroxymethyltransferase